MSLISSSFGDDEAAVTRRLTPSSHRARFVGVTNSTANLISVAAPVVAHIAHRVLRTVLPFSAPALLAPFSSCETAAELRSSLGNVKGLQPVDREMLQRAIPVIDAAEAGDPVALSGTIAAALDDLRFWEDEMSTFDDGGRRWEYLGTLAIDSGIVLLTDACHASSLDDDIDEVLGDLDPAECYPYCRQGALNRVIHDGAGNIGRKGAGVVVQAPDGLYEVQGQFVGDRLVAFRVEL